MPTLLVIEGPTGVGKSNIAIEVAERLSCPIVNADSRQIYSEIPIGTAAPTEEQRQRVKHYFVGTHSLKDKYNAGQYEREVLQLLDRLFQTHKVVVLSGGSMLYVDAVCYGLDDLPDVKPSTRQNIQTLLKSRGLEYLQNMLLILDPVYYKEVDLNNPQRVCHALEICVESGRPYSALRTARPKTRPFNIVRVALTRPRPTLYARINKRVDLMVNDGLLTEAEKVLAPYQHIEQLPNSLNTVGYRELMLLKEGQLTLAEAIDLIKQNTRHYAKRQLTWLRSRKDIHWININDYETQDMVLDTIIALLA